MKTTPTSHESIGNGDVLVHDWRVSQLTRLGVPQPLAELYVPEWIAAQDTGLAQRGGGRFRTAR